MSRERHSEGDSVDQSGECPASGGPEICVSRREVLQMGLAGAAGLFLAELAGFPLSPASLMQCRRAPLCNWMWGSISPASADLTAIPWYDNERQFKSDDPKYNFRRSEHFRIMWGKGAAEDKNANNDFGQVTEQLVQGNLQMLEQVWHRYHDPLPGGIGFNPTGESVKPENRDGKHYRINLVMNNTGVWAGGSWGSVDDWGFPLFALPPSYLRFDPPSGATPHEYGHTALITAGGFNDTPWDGMWHEATANWLMLQFENSYPGPGGVGTQPYLCLPHGRNYYDAWLLWEALKDDPVYGYPFVNKVWTQAHGNKAKGGEYLYDALVRLDTSGSPDAYNAIKNLLGRMAAHSVNWDYLRQPYFQKLSPRSTDPFSEMYRRAFTELTRRQGDESRFRAPFAHAPMQCGYNMVRIALPDKTGERYSVSIDFQPLWDATRRSDWRATLVAINDNGEARYSSMWNSGINSMTLARDENKLYLVVAATPDFMPYDGFSHPRITDLPLQPQAYEISFVDTKATPYNSLPQRPAGTAGNSHANGGGFVANTAKVDETAFIGPGAMVLDRAQVLGSARVEDYAVVRGDAVVRDKARISGHALVEGHAQVADNGKVRDWATVSGNWKISENGRALERAFLNDHGQLHGHATIKGNVPDYGGADVKGYAIKEGDCANSANVDHQVLVCWVWGIDQKYADEQPDTGGLYCNFRFNRQSPIYALDHFGLMHGYLMGSPETLAVDDPAIGHAIQLNGKNQYIELKRDVADFMETTIAAWVRWDGGSAGQRIVHFGDGANRYAYLTPRDNQTGSARFVISVDGKHGEQSLAAPAALPVGEWTHVAVTLKAGSATMYINSKAAASSTTITLTPDMVLGPNTLDGQEVTLIGRGDRGDYFKGLISDFRIYALPQDDATVAGLASTVKNPKATATAPTRDTEAPLAGLPEFLLKPTVWGKTCVAMSGPRPADKNQMVEYLFTCTRGDGHSSGWISSNWWADCVLSPGRSYSYTFRMRSAAGTETPASTPVAVSIPRWASTPIKADFETGPAGISTTAIRMTAALPEGAGDSIKYRFAREDGKNSGWQRSRTWLDNSLIAGSSHSYTVQARGEDGRPGPVSAPKAAIARDDMPPARYPIGEWQTLPTAMIDNTIAMRAMGVHGEDGCPTIEPDPVEYFFHCTSGNSPDSGWVTSPAWRTPPLPEGTYSYQFKIRNTSPQHNETPYSSTASCVISGLTGYHNYPLAGLLDRPEGTLVSFSGKVTAVDKDFYTVSDDRGSSVKVMSRAVAGATDATMNGKSIKVQGCLWTCSGEKRVTWAELTGHAT